MLVDRALSLYFLWLVSFATRNLANPDLFVVFCTDTYLNKAPDFFAFAPIPTKGPYMKLNDLISLCITIYQTYGM
jgi:hypothetical protein